jgi:hypothetical protein
MDLNAIAAALAAQIGAHTGLRSHGTAPGAISPPACVVIPGRPAVTYGVTMDGETNINLLAIVALSAANDVSGQDQLLKYVSTSGAKSVLAAVAADPTLAGTCEFAIVASVSTYGLIEWAGQQYIGATFVIQAAAHD